MGLVYTILNPVFSPLLSLGTVYAILVLALVINLISSGLTKKFVDTKRMKELQLELKKYKRPLKEAAKAADDKQYQREQAKMMELQQEMMKLQTPMFFTIIPVLFVFFWMREAFGDLGTVISLPYSLPHWGSQLGWLGWYILCSFPLNSLVRRVLRIV